MRERDRGHIEREIGDIDNDNDNDYYDDNSRGKKKRERQTHTRLVVKKRKRTDRNSSLPPRDRDAPLELSSPDTLVRRSEGGGRGGVGLGVVRMNVNEINPRRTPFKRWNGTKGDTPPTPAPFRPIVGLFFHFRRCMRAQKHPPRFNLSTLPDERTPPLNLTPTLSSSLSLPPTPFTTLTTPRLRCSR